MKQLSFWLPRLLSIAFVAFISLFSLDMFSEYSGWESLLGFLIHLAPVFALAIAIGIAWKFEWVGVAIFFAMAIAYPFLAGFDRPWSWYAAISLPAAIVGCLYIWSWWEGRRVRPAEPGATGSLQ